MTVAITSIDRTSVPTDGGYELRIFGTFEPGTSHRVFIGPKGDTTDPIAHGGQGQGDLVFPLNTTEMRVFTPLLPLDGPHDVLVVQTSTSLSSELRGVLEAVHPDFKSIVFDMRKVMPPFYRTGPRSMEQLPQVVPLP
jgi:hypothetical protein